MVDETFVSKLDLWRDIREKCLECCGGGVREVRFCTSPSCPIYRHRFGRKPALTDYAYVEGDEVYLSRDMEEIHRKRLQEQAESNALG